MSSFWSEFRVFIQRGNVIDLAIGVIIGGAFGKIVTSAVNDIIMPPIGLIVGGVNFSALKVVIGGAADAPVTINYGAFLQTITDFLIISFCIFLLIKVINAIQQPPEAPPAAAPEPTPTEKLLAEIRDALKTQK